MDPNKIIVTIEWRVEDIMEAMKEHDIEPTEERILEFLNPKEKNIKNLEDESILAGWDVICAAIEKTVNNNFLEK